MVFVILGLSIAVATVVLLVTIINTTKADIDRKLDEFGANIVIFPKSDSLTLSYGGITVQGASYDVKDLNERDAALIKTVKNAESISAIAPKLVGAVKVGNRDALFVGVRFKDELRVKKWWVISGHEPGKNNEVVLGSQAARIFKKRLNEDILINGSPFKISGILKETGEQDDSLIFAKLPIVQSMLDKKGKLSLIEISALCSTCPIDEINRQISAKLPYAQVSTIKQAVESKMNSVDQLAKFSLVVSIILMVIGALIVLITMMASINERTREIGIFRAIGFRKQHIMQIVMTEAILISILGGLIGYTVGLTTALIIAPRIAELSIPVVIDIKLLGEAILLAVALGLLGSIYPALHAAKLEPASALRSI